MLTLKQIRPIKYFIIGVLSMLNLLSCEEDISKLNKNLSKNFPSTVINNAKILQRDSGFITIKAVAPILEKYELIDSPYTVAKKGIEIQFFDKKKPKNPGKINANFAKIYDYKSFYEAKGDVKILTQDGKTFKTQTVYWDQKKKTIYTKDTVYATFEDGSTLVHANGMKAKDDLSEYEFYNNSGDIDIKKAKIVKQ